MAFFLNFKKSALELKTLRCLTTTAILIALAVALKYFTFYISDTLRISFAFVALASIAMLFGPTVAGLAGIAIDIIGYLIKPNGAFSPMFTVIEMITAIIYGIYLYNLKPVKLDGKNDFTKQNVLQVLRIIISELTVLIVCNLFLTPVAFILGGYETVESMTIKYPLRLIKNAAQFPVNVVILIAVLPIVMFAYRQAMKNTPARAAGPKT